MHKRIISVIVNTIAYIVMLATSILWMPLFIIGVLILNSQKESMINKEDNL